MATIADLNVRLGVINNLSKGLAKAERDWRRAGERMAGIGQQISLSIGVPLGLIGTQAVKAAGDIESMTLALTAQLGSTQAAREELEKLRVSALAPGLGFEQAVKGSVQLQAVGFSAERARRTIEAFGNGLALAGKGGQELDGVLLALTQISAKGVVSAEEINQIAERLPQIRTLMKQAFGTASTEALQKLGITSEVFIDGITKGLEKLPKATGGIKNAFDNLRDSVNQSLAKIGLAINEVFDIAGIFDSAGRALNGAAKAFDSLSDGTKRFVVILGGALTAIGPLLIGIGSLKTLGSLAAGGLLVITNGLKAIAANALLAARAFQALSLAQKAFGIGAVLFLVYSLVTAFAEYNAELKSTTAAQRALNDVNKTAEENIISQRLEAERLTKVATDQNSTLEEQQKALDGLVKIAPEYYGSLDRTSLSVEKVREATNRYVQSLLIQAKVQAAKESLVDLEKQLLRVEKNSDPSILQELGNAILSVGNQGLFAAKNAITYTENLAKNKDELNSTKKALEEYLVELTKGIDVSSKIDETKPPGPSPEAIAAAKERAKEYAKALASIEAVAEKGDVLGSELIGEQATEINNQIERLLELGFKPYSKEIENLRSLLKGLRADIQVGANFAPLPTLATPDSVVSIGAVGGEGAKKAFTDLKKASADTRNSIVTDNTALRESFALLNAGTITTQELFSKLWENMKIGSAAAAERVEIFANGLQGLGQAIGSSLADGAASFQDFARSAVDALSDVVGALFRVFIAGLLKNAVISGALNPAVALAIGGAAAAIGTGLFKRLTTPKLAKGGLAFGPTTAIVGDNPGARSNPEVIAPLDKLKSFLQPQQQAGGIVGEYVVRGQDLLVVLKRAEMSNQRLTGKR